MSLLHVNDSIPDYIALTCAQNIYSECRHTNTDEDVRNMVDNFGKSFNNAKTPKILIMSLEAMYKTIQDTYETNPIVCCKFLQSILTYLESLQPGDWVNEGEEIIDYLFKLLLGIIQTIDIQTSRVINRSRSMTNSLHRSVKLIDASLSCSDDCFQSYHNHTNIQNKLCNIATGCLFSIGIAKGSISMIMAATNAVLIRNGLVDDNEMMQVPSLILKMKSLSDLTYKSCDQSHSGNFPLLRQLPDNVNSGSLVSNGTYLFWLTSVGILKIGSGFNGSIKGYVYQCNDEMGKHWSGWMGIVSNSILFHTSGPSRNFKISDTINFFKINLEHLQIDEQISLKMENFLDYTNSFSWKCYFFSNFLRLGCCIIKDDDTNSERLYLKMYRQCDKHLIEESEKVIDLTQHLMWKIDADKSKTDSNTAQLIETTNQMSLVSEVMHLEEFCLVRTVSGELYYKDLDNKESNNNNNVEHWTQLIYNNCIETKFDKLIGGIDNKFICAISDDGLWRISCNKHSQPHSLFLHRLMSNSRFLSKTWIGGSCSRDNLALVSKEGQVMFLEKDSIHSISTCHGALLSPYHITQISLGKSHGACLSRNGYLITFGVNNYHQCGFANTDNDGKLNDMYQEMDNNNTNTRTSMRSKVSKHQVPTIKPQKLLIYSEPNSSGTIKNRSNFLRIQQVSCGYYHTVLLTVNGDIYSFGNNKFNQLGRSNISIKELPRAIPLQSKALCISTGAFSTCLLNQAGKVLIYGSKHVTPIVVDVAVNFLDSTSNFQPIFLGLNLDNTKNQVIYCVAKHTMLSSMKLSTSQVSRRVTISDPERVCHISKNNHLIIESLHQNNLLIDIVSGSLKVLRDKDHYNTRRNSVKCIDPKYPLVWSVDQSEEDRTIVIKYQDESLCSDSYVPPRIDPLIDLSHDTGFQSQRHRIALNVLVSSEKLLLEKYRDFETNTNNDCRDKNAVEDIHSVKRFGKENSNWLYSPNAHDCITFSVSESVYILGVGLYTGGGDNTMSVKIYEETAGDSDTDDLMVTNILNFDQQPSTLILLSETERTDIQTSENRKIVRLMLGYPIMIFPNKSYVIVAIITGDSTDFGFQGRTKIETDLGVTFKFKSSKNSSNGTHVKEGQIPEIYYSLRLPEARDPIGDPEKAMSIISAVNMAEYLTGQISMNSLSSSVALLNWIYTGLTCLFSELPDLHEDQVSPLQSLRLLRSLDSLKLYTKAFVSTLKIIRKHIQYLYPYHGVSKDIETQETSVIIGDFRIIIRNIFLECKLCHYMSLIKQSFGGSSIIFKDCWALYVEELIPVFKETLEYCYYIFYPEIADQRTTLQDSLMKVYELCENKSNDTLCNYGKISYLTSLLTALNSINDQTVFQIQNNSVTSLVKPDVKLNQNFSDRYPLLRDYMRTIWKSNSNTTSDMTSNISTMIHCLLSVLTLDLAKFYKPCRHTHTSNSTGNDTEERQLYEEEMTNLINASHLTLKHIINILIDQMTILNKTSSNNVSDIQSSNSKNHSKYNDQNNREACLDGVSQITQSRFRQVFWLDKQEDIDPETRKTNDPSNGDFRELVDVISFDVTKATHQFINGYEVTGDSTIYFEGLKVYCSNHKQSQCSVYVYKRNKFPDVSKDEMQLIPVNYEWKREDHELITWSLVFGKKIKLEESYQYAVKIYLKVPKNEKVIIGQHSSSKLDAKFGFCFDLSDGGLGSLCNASCKQGIIASLIYSINNGNTTPSDTKSLERKITKMCILEFIAHIKFTLISTVKETNQDEGLTVGRQLFLRSFLPYFCQKISSIAETSKQIACQSISLVRESLSTIQECLKFNDDNSYYNKDYFVIVESSHPYEQAKYLQKTIIFPPPVEVVSINFDNQCVTSQPEDYLSVKVRSNKGPEKEWKVLCKNLSHTALEWPKKPIVFIGNEICVEFHTSSLYEESLQSSYGFRCTITGHIERKNDYSELVENSLTFLASKCASSLLEYRSKSKIIKLVNESRILEKCSIYRSIFDRGLSLSKLPTLTDCLNKSPLEYVNSMQTNFIKKFVEGLNSVTENNGSSPSIQLAKWFQSCPVVVVNKCKVQLTPSSTSELQINQDHVLDFSNIVGKKLLLNPGKEVHFQMELVDQYDTKVSCHKCTIDVMIHYVHKGINSSLDINDKVFGGHLVPNTTVPYERTVIGKDSYHSINMMKNYEMYSFEEIRLAGVQENVSKSETLKAKWIEQEGIFKFDWVPRTCGQFHLVVRIDRLTLGSSNIDSNVTTIIDVIRSSSPINVPPEKLKKKNDNTKDKLERSKYLWFEGKQSSGLRLRSQPSFYSPVLGIIPCHTIIKFEEELYTDNSIWVRLQNDSFQQWYGYYISDPLEQQLAISLDLNHHNQDINCLRKKTIVKPQIHSSALCKKTMKSNMKPFTEGWCLREHMKKVFLTAAKFNYNETIPKDTTVKFASAKFGLAGIGDHISKTLPTQRRSSVKSLQTKQINNNNNAVSLPNSPEMALKRKTGAGLTTSSSASTSQQTSPNTIRRRSTRTSVTQTLTEAISPFQAKTQRSLFAAICWQNGLISDLMQVAESINLYSAYQNLEKQVNNANQTDENRNNNNNIPDLLPYLPAAITRSNSQNTGDLSLLSDSDGIKNLAFPTAPRIIPSLADLVANAVAATSNSINEKFEVATNSPPSPVSNIKRSHSHMDERTPLVSQAKSTCHRGKHFIQFGHFKEEARKLGLHISLDEELLNISKPSSSSNNRINETLQSEITAKLNQLTKLWDTISAILSLSEEQSQFNKTDDVTDKIKDYFSTSLTNENSYAKQDSLSFYQKVYDNTMLLLELEPMVPLKYGFQLATRDNNNTCSKMNDTSRVLSPNNDDESRVRSKHNPDQHLYSIPQTTRIHSELESDIISRTSKLKQTSFPPLFTEIWPIHNLQKGLVNMVNQNAYPANTIFDGEDSSTYLTCDCWSCLPLLKQSDGPIKANFSSGNITEMSLPNSSFGTACGGSSALKHYIMRMHRPSLSTMDHTSSDSNSTSLRPQMGSTLSYNTQTMIGQLLHSMMTLLVNTIASSSSGVEIFDRSVMQSHSDKKEFHSLGLLEMRFCLCNTYLTELRLSLQECLQAGTIEQYCYQTYFWMMESMRHSSSQEIVMWCLYNILSSKKLIQCQETYQNDKIIEDKRLKLCYQQLWAVGSSVFYRILDDIVHSNNLINLKVTDIKLLEIMIKLSNMLLFSDGSGDATSQMFMSFEKSQVFYCLSEVLNQLDDLQLPIRKAEISVDASITQSPLDITKQFSHRVSSNIDTSQALFDDNTDMFWESAGLTVDQYPCITIKLIPNLKNVITTDHIIVAVYIDRIRDIVNGQLSVVARLQKTDVYEQITVPSDHVGWLDFHLLRPGLLENDITVGFHLIADDEIHNSAANGVINDKIRVRSVKIFDGSETVSVTYHDDKDRLRLRYDLVKEETLKSFISMTNHIFHNCFTSSYQNKIEKLSNSEDFEQETKSLQDFLVNVLFDTGFKSDTISSRLNSLQRRVLSHIISQINIEVTKNLNYKQRDQLHTSDTGQDQIFDQHRCSCCFQLLNQVLALSEAQAGLRFLVHQAQLIRDLIVLLNIGSEKIKIQIIFAITRIFSALNPKSLEDILYGILLHSDNEPLTIPKTMLEKSFLPINILILFAGKSLNIQLKSKVTSTTMFGRGIHESLKKIRNLPKYIQSSDGDIGSTMKIYRLISQLFDESNHTAWYVYIQEWLRDVFENFVSIDQNPDPINLEALDIYLLICTLPLFQNVKLAYFWNNLSSTARVLKSGDKNLCTNHDDGTTLATIVCYTCQSSHLADNPGDNSLSSRLVFLCAECDRYLHLSKMTKYHIRDGITTRRASLDPANSIQDCLIISQESCVRLKSNKFSVTLDLSTLKILIHCTQAEPCAVDEGTTPDNAGFTKPDLCRFCNESLGSRAKNLICESNECQIKGRCACTDRIPVCGHWCSGVSFKNKDLKDQKICPPICLNPKCSNQTQLTINGLKQDGDDVCMICFTDTLLEAPIIILDNCHHILHYHCVRRQLEAGWPGYRVTFNFRRCPFCKLRMEHQALKDLLEPINLLEKEVKRKALLRLEHEGLMNYPEAKDPDGLYKDDPEEFAAHRYCYYLCYKCKNPYYGGEGRCDPEIGLNPGNYDEKMTNKPVTDPATELCCAACSDVAQAKVCPKHSTDFLEYKCRYCCSVAVFFCFGTTHFCQRCHDNLDTVLKAQWLPTCPAGPALQQLSGTECPLHVIHPPTGEEFALGCALCRKLDTF